jgi:uncharacterized protein
MLARVRPAMIDVPMESFTPLSALVGGALIGLAASALWLLSGRIAGVSGIVATALFDRRERGWQIAFIAGLVAGGLFMAAVSPPSFAPSARPLALLAGAGLLVGAGTSLAGGCTSGHGVCGVGRLSPRSIAATATFMVTGALAVALLRWLGIA